MREPWLNGLRRGVWLVASLAPVPLVALLAVAGLLIGFWACYVFPRETDILFPASAYCCVTVAAILATLVGEGLDSKPPDWITQCGAAVITVVASLLAIYYCVALNSPTLRTDVEWLGGSLPWGCHLLILGATAATLWNATFICGSGAGSTPDSRPLRTTRQRLMLAHAVTLGYLAFACYWATHAR